MEEVLAKQQTYLVASDYKTACSHGDLGKHLCPGTLDAIGSYLELPRGDSGLFLDPSDKSKSQAVCIADCLRRFGAVYLPKFQHPTVNLMRKWFTARTKFETDKALAFVARIQGHSLGIADRVYAVATPEQDAEVGKHLADVMLDGPVGPLGPQDMAEASIESLKKRFARGRNGEDSGDEGETSESESDGLAEMVSSDEDPPVIDLEAGDLQVDKLPRGKRPRLVGFSVPAAASSGGPKSSDEKLEQGEKVYLLSRVVVLGKFRWPSGDALHDIIAAGIEEGSLRPSLHAQSVVSFLKFVQQSAAAEGE